MPTADPTERLAELAIAVALEAPLRRGQHVHSASIPWVVIEEIRGVLESAGVDWRRIARERHDALRAAEATRVAAMTAAQRARRIGEDR